MSGVEGERKKEKEKKEMKGKLAVVTIFAIILPLVTLFLLFPFKIAQPTEIKQHTNKSLGFFPFP